LTLANGRGRGVRHAISFDSWYRVLSSALFLPPSGAFVRVEAGEVEARMGWAFRARFPRSAVTSVSRLEMRPLSRGVHGFAGRWLVNGSGRNILVISLNPTQRARVLGVPVGLRELLVSVEDPEELAAALRAG
jgi:hypothetical protein